jgi:hypothetical protein
MLTLQRVLLLLVVRVGVVRLGGLDDVVFDVPEKYN